MPKDFNFYVRLAQQMIDDDSAEGGRQDEYDAYAEIYHGDWSIPDELKDVHWLRPVISGDGFDAISAGSRVLSSTVPKPKKIPLIPNEENKKEANKQEKNLSFQLKAANRRRQMTVEQETTTHALLYSEVTAMVVDLEWQLKQAKGVNANTTRIQAARDISRFMVNNYDPRDVHVRRSNYGPEAVLLAQKRRASEVLDEWGEAALGLQQWAEDNVDVLYYDYMDYTTRVVWCAMETGDTDAGGNQVEIVPPTPHGLPFLPWVCVKGGKAMLYPLWTTGNWKTQNVVRSIYVSTIIRNAGQPPLAEEGTNPKNTEVDHVSGDPVKVQPGNQLKPLQPPSPDVALSDIDDRIQAQTEKSTVSRVLQGGEMPAGTSYSALNLLTQTAVGALKPAQELSERALAEIFKLMLLWVEHTEIDLHAYGTDKRSDLGESYVIAADEIDKSDIFIEVELTPDAPTDRMQRAQAAGQMTQWGYPREYALEDVGVENPVEAMTLWYTERQKEHLFALQQQQQMLQMQMQLEQMSMQMQAQQAQMAQQQEAQAVAQQQSMMNAAGEGVNPNNGGTPPIQAEPGMQTREQVTGQDFAGTPVGAPEVL